MGKELQIRHKHSLEKKDNKRDVISASGGTKAHITEGEVRDYMRNHLFIKSCLDQERTLIRSAPKKISIRNYTPKILGQEINMGMWM